VIARLGTHGAAGRARKHYRGLGSSISYEARVLASHATARAGLPMGPQTRLRDAPDSATRETFPMRPNPIHASDDPEVVQQLIRENPWCTLVSSNNGELVASHYPVLLDEESPQLAVLTHVGRPDDRVHGFGQREIMLIVQGRHGYISPSWYVPGTTPAPTWNFSVAHCYGVPEILSAEENLRVLTRLVAHFERYVDHPQFLDPEAGAQLAKGTFGLRIPIARFVCKIKLSHDKSPENQRRVIAALRAPGPYRHLALADDMEGSLAD
jgi:transcriptional regulator